MLKKSLLLFGAALLAQGAMAEALSPEQALARAASQKNVKRIIGTVAPPQLAFTAKSTKGEPTLYVYNKADNGGFLLLSADDVALPVLGYTDDGKFDPNAIPPQMQYWMEEYGRQIEYARSQGLTPQTNEATQSFPSSWKSITPMLSTLWDQSAPYNLLCPKIGGRAAYTGCVATAMAQVMNYWKYPETATGEIAYSCTGLGTLRMNFDNQPAFDWDNMLNSYSTGKYTQAEGDAVANLMVQCGYAVQMQYRSDGSGTQTELVPNAMARFFGYNTGITAQQRLPYTATQWNELCYSQLAVGPVIYSGTAPEGGHCWVMDGYDGDGYFHFNWGWAGLCNGYYLLNALNPADQGAGGAYGGYNFGETILTGVQPTYSAPVVEPVISMSINCSLEAKYNSPYLTFSYTNASEPRLANDCTVSFTPQLGIEITNEDGTGTPTYVAIASTFPNFSPGSYVPLTTLRVRFPDNLTDGKYKVRWVCKNTSSGSDGQWHYLYSMPENFDYVIVTKIGSSYGVQNMKPLKFNVTDATITTPLYYNNPLIIDMSFSNSNTEEVTRNIIPYLYKDNKAMYEGENRLVTVAGNGTENVTINTSFTQMNGATVPTTSAPVDFDLVIVDGISGEKLGTFGPVTMKRSGSNVRLTLRKLDITNAPEKGMVDGVGYLYGLNNFKDINLELTFEVTGGFVATPITAIISEYDPATQTVGAQVFEQDLIDMLYLSSGETLTRMTAIHFNDYDVNSMYQLGIYYKKNRQRQALSSIRFAASSGVEEIIGDSNGFNVEINGTVATAVSPVGIRSIEAYDAGGTKVIAGTDGTLDMSSLANGLYIIMVIDNEGNTKVVKTVR